MDSLHERLKALQREAKTEQWKRFNPYYGICCNINSFKKLRKLFPCYPRFSGDVSFPIRSLVKNIAPADWYCWSNPGNRYVGRHGRQRMHLLSWLIKQTAP
jgi:hypothetical protein